MSQVHTPAKPEAGPRLDGRTILVADDEPACRELTLAVLAAAGAVVRQAEDGRRAVLAAASAPPDLVITDLDMPELDGIEVARSLRWDFGLRELPVVLLTADTADPAALLAAGVNALLAKPVAPRPLLTAVASCLGAGAGIPYPAGDEGSRIFDVGGALSRLGDRGDLLAGLVEIFREDHAHTVADIAAALATGDDTGARRLCHALRGTGASLGAGRLREITAELEEELAAGRDPGAERLARLHEAHAAAAAAMEHWLAGRGPDRGGHR